MTATVSETSSRPLVEHVPCPGELIYCPWANSAPYLSGTGNQIVQISEGKWLVGAMLCLLATPTVR